MSTIASASDEITDLAATSDCDLPVTVYSPESPLSNPKKLVAEIFTDLWKSRELIQILFFRDLKAQFRQSYFGYLWLIMPPLMTTLVWLFLNSQKVVTVPDTGMPYAIFVIVGTVFWQSFAAALESPLKAFNAGKPVFMKLKVPPEAFIVAGSARVAFDFAISLLLLIPVFITYRITPSWTLVLLPIAILCLYLLGTAIGLMLLPIGALYQDIGRAISVFMRFAMYLSPVVFPIPQEGFARTVILINPVTPILETARAWLVTGPTDSVWGMLMWLPVTLVLCLIGFVVLRVVMPHLVARMGM